MGGYKQIEWTDEQVAKFWDYEVAFPANYFTYQFGRAIIGKFSKYLGTRRNILDYGCGTGFLIPSLLKYGTVTAADFSKKSVEEVKRKFKNEVDFKGAFMLDEILSSNSKFDAIFVIEVIEHLENPHLKKIFDNLKKLLSPGGIIIFTTPNDEDLAASRVFCPECEHVFHRWQHVRSWSEKTLTEFLETNGFRPIDAFTTDFSASFKFNKKNFLKHMAKRILEPQFKMPHLACVCELKV